MCIHRVHKRDCIYLQGALKRTAYTRFTKGIAQKGTAYTGFPILRGCNLNMYKYEEGGLITALLTLLPLREFEKHLVCS